MKQLCNLVIAFRLTAIVSLLLPGCLATFCPTSKNNVVLYWGQGPNQLDLLHYCQQSHVDMIILSFVHLFPAQANGFLGINFGNQCGHAVFPGPGFQGVNEPRRDALLADCPSINAQIPVCQQTYGKKILLSLGGGMLSYQLTGTHEADQLADQLWTMFGPRNETMVAQGIPRPLDYKDSGTEVDGFDMDIEHTSTDNSIGYNRLVTRLRSYFPSATKRYLLTASPQCIVPDANMASMISAAEFDMIFVQFYNTPHCSAATWAKANRDLVPGTPSDIAGFTFDD
ncbi:hypothetical protein ACHAQA_004481 [Verticillium albo-atrum]